MSYSPGRSPAAFIAHWARRLAHLAKYNAVLSRQRPGRAKPCLIPKGKHPTFVGCFPFGIRQCPTLPGVRQPPSSIRGTHIVAAYSRSLWFPTLRLPVSATGGGRLRSHWRRQAPVPQGAAMASPSQVQCCTLSGRGAGKRHSRWQTKKDPGLL